MKFLSAWLIFTITFSNFIQSQTVSSNEANSYEKVTYLDFIDLLESLTSNRQYNSLFRFSNAFTDFAITDIPPCASSPSKKCQNPLIEISNFENGDQFVKTLPTVFLIAGFHGDETVGIHALYYLIKYIEKNYEKDKDLYALLQQVRLLILPMANVNGFESLKREESVSMVDNKFMELDPNRDFSFDLTKKGRCFQTTTARIIDSIFRKNLIVSALTFHGGNNSISYPWGNFAHSKYPYTADNTAFGIVADVLKRVSGGNPALKIEEYTTGTMQRVVYDVHGGFEDWAYGASFDVTNVSRSCGGRTKLSYTEPYPHDSNRAFVYLVEAGPEKDPDPSTFGNELAMNNPKSDGAIWGHVTRNMKLSLAFAELTSPQIIIDGVALGNFLDIDLRVKGCSKLDSLKVIDYGYVSFQQEHDIENNLFKLQVSIKPTEMFYPQLKIRAYCDGNWLEAKNTSQSHLVKLRTDNKYSAENNGYFVSANNFAEASILNIKLTDLKISYLSLGHNGIYSMLYTSTLEADWSLNKIIFTYSDGNLITSFDHDDEETKIALIRIKKFDLRSTADISVYSTLLQFAPHEKVPMSLQFFFNLQGRSLELANSANGDVFHETHIMPLNNDPDSLVVLPPGGVSCGTGRHEENYFYVELTYNNKDSEIRADVFTNVEDSYKFKIGNLSDDLFKFDSFDNSAFPNIVNYTKSVPISNLNDLRLLGQTFQFLRGNDKEEFSCRVMRKDPAYDERDNIKQQMKEEEIPKIILKENDDPTDWKLFVLVMAIFIIAAVVLILIRKEWGSQEVKIDEENPKEAIMIKSISPNDVIENE